MHSNSVSSKSPFLPKINTVHQLEKIWNCCQRWCTCIYKAYHTTHGPSVQQKAQPEQSMLLNYPHYNITQICPQQSLFSDHWSAKNRFVRQYLGSHRFRLWSCSSYRSTSTELEKQRVQIPGLYLSRIQFFQDFTLIRGTWGFTVARLRTATDTWNMDFKTELENVSGG